MKLRSETGSTWPASSRQASRRWSALRAAVEMRARPVGPEHGDPDAARVEPLRVGADDVLDQAPAAALEDPAVLVDEVVVADVVPAVREHVVALDAAHDGRRLRRRIAVRPRRVVHDRELEAVRERRLRPHDGLVGAPARTPGDRRLIGPQRRLRGRRGQRRVGRSRLARDEERPQARDGPGDAVLDRRRARPSTRDCRRSSPARPSPRRSWRRGGRPPRGGRAARRSRCRTRSPS